MVWAPGVEIMKKYPACKELTAEDRGISLLIFVEIEELSH